MNRTFYRIPAQSHINNVPSRIGAVMPESCVITINADSSRTFYLFDLSHPEVVL